LRKSLLLLAVAPALVLTAVGEGASPPPDRIAPSKPTVDGAGHTTDLRPVFHFGARDNRTAPAQIRFRCAIDSSLLHTCARIYQPFAALPFGPHVLRVRALDRAGNASRLTTAVFTVDGRWDAEADFPFAPRPENPAHDHYGNTAWFYLYGPPGLHDPTLYQPLPEFHVIDPANQYWDFGFRPDGSIATPLVGGNAAQKFMVFHPDHLNSAILGWRSPYTGKVSIALQLSFPDPVVQAGSNGVVWSLDRGGTMLQGALLTPGNEARVTMTLDITAGETLYLVISDNGDTNWDTTVGQLVVQTVYG
jgi:hypothetical protein